MQLNPAKKQFDTVESSDVIKLNILLMSGELKLEKDCLAWEPQDSAYKGILSRYYTACENMDDSTNKNLCTHSTGLYRAIRLQRYIESEDLKKLKDEELAILFFSHLTGEISQKKAKLSEVAEELLDRHPNSSSAQRALVFNKVSSLGTDAGELDEALSYVEEAVQKFPQDERMKHAQFFLWGRLASDKRKIKFDQYFSKGGKNPMAYYMLAAMNWNSHDRETTLRNLQKALDIDPDESMYKVAMIKAKVNPFTDDIFPMDFHLRYDAF